MNLKFYGSLRELSKIIDSLEFRGGWVKPAQRNKKVFRFNNGALMNWWPSSGSINFQGNIESKEQVQAVLAPMLFSKLGETSSRTTQKNVWFQ